MTTSPPALDPRPATARTVRLGDLEVLSGGPPLSAAAADTAVSGLTLASGDVRAGDLYAALPGQRTHGVRYAAAAVEAGAAAVLSDAAGAAELAGRVPRLPVPVVVVDDPRALLGALAAAVYGRPADKMLTLGVTGTQGKTTVTYLIESALRAAGRTPGLVGTTGSLAAGRPIASRLTTPEAPDLHAILAVMVEQGVDTCAMEVSSHALVQGRVDGVAFDVAAFLNLGRDHLDFHGDVDSYFAAKAELFTPGRTVHAVIDVGDEWGRRLATRLAARGLAHTTCTATVDPQPAAAGSSPPAADWTVADVSLQPQASQFTVIGPDGRSQSVHLPLPGSFNVRNALAAVVVLAVAGLPLAAVAAGLGRATGLPGRMEPIDEGQDFTAIVDYAHKPDAVEAVLGAVRPATAGRLLIVLGAGGDRDPGKRPLMAALAAALADVLVVTDDNPRSEDAATIRSQLLAGVDTASPHAELIEEPDRALAIERAVAMARTGDTVVVAGKGHETGQEIGGTVHPFDDREVLRRLLRARAARAPA